MCPPERTGRPRIPGYFLSHSCVPSPATDGCCTSCFLSTMSPSTFSPNVLHILLQYISPPSQLTQPIPPHLLSKPLLQRHHFLHLTPEQPDEYLCWPSSPEKKAHIVDLLETRSRPLDDDQPTAYPVQYSFDGEDFFAHVDHGPRRSRARDAPPCS